MANTEFELGGINHLALACSDMQRTVDFYSNVLGMRLIKTVELPNGMGQHFFFDCGGGSALAFFWFPNAPEKLPGVTHPGGMPGLGDISSAVASMNHVALHIPVDKLYEYRDRLSAKGVEVGQVLFHDDSPSTVATRMHDGVYVGSLYFLDPDGILLEFAAWTRELTPADVRHPGRGPANGDRRRVRLGAAALDRPPSDAPYSDPSTVELPPQAQWADVFDVPESIRSVSMSFVTHAMVFTPTRRR